MGEGARIRQHRWVGDHVIERDRLQRGQRVIRRHHELQAVLPDRLRAQRGAGVRCQCGHRQFHLAAQHRRVSQFRIQELDVQGRLRMLCGEASQQCRQPVQPHVVTGGQAQPPADRRAQVLQHAARVVQFGQDALRARQQRQPGLGQHHLAAQAVEQPCRQLRFQ